MDILIVGLGVIGTTYGFVFKQVGQNVEHYIREGSEKKNIKSLSVSMLDGRKSSKGIQITGQYYVVQSCSKREYDLIIVSVAQGKVDEVLRDISNAGIRGTILLCCNLWYDKHELDEMMQGYDYILGFPVAGGCIETKSGEEECVRLDCCLFNHFMLEAECKSKVPNYKEICQLFTSCNIKLEKPHDMLEWIWLHMAINAAVIVVAGKNGNINNSSEAALKLMNSVSLLSTVIRVIRETIKIVASRGINLRKYRNELWVYKVPIYFSTRYMKRMFAKSNLTRKIMELHSNIGDLLYICKSIYKEGISNHIPAPIFYHFIEDLQLKLKGLPKK